MALVMSYNLVLLSQYLVEGAENCPNNAVSASHQYNVDGSNGNGLLQLIVIHPTEEL